MIIIKTTNQKHILIIVLFTIITLISLTIPLKYMLLLTSPVTLITICWILRKEIKLAPDILDNDTLQQAFYAFAICMGSQWLNLIGVYLFKQTDIVQITTVMLPVIPIYTVIFAPILEETIFRKIIYGYLQRNKERFSILAASISSVLFAIMHMNLQYILGYFAVGFVLCFFYHKHKRIEIVILAHVLFNFIVLFKQSIGITFGG